MTTNWFDWPDEPEPDPEPQVWTLADIYDDLGTLADVAAYLNITKGRIWNWSRIRFRDSTPQPVLQFGNVYVYSKQEWKAWFDKWMESVSPHNRVRNARPFEETRMSKLDPTYKFGNLGINNALLDWRKAKAAAKEAADAADAN